MLFGAGSVVAALSQGNGKLAGEGLVPVALTFGLVIAISIHAFGSTSGAHLNPAVTVSLALTGRFPRYEVLPYIGAQLVGAFVGALLIVAAFGGDVAVKDAAVGSTALGKGVTYLQGIVAEALATFLLVTAVMALAVDRRAPVGWAGLIIGLSVTTAILVTGALTGASLNPARTFGPLLASTLFGGDTNWGELPIYIIGPLLGGAAAALLYDFVARPWEEAETRSRAQGTQGEIEGRRAAEPASPARSRRQGTAGDVPGGRR